MERVIDTFSEQETENLGFALGEMLFPGAVVLLQGDLGAGKSVLARGVGRGLGVITPIGSPTFTLMNAHLGRLPFYHFDLYRLESTEELFQLGIDDYLYGDGVSLLEWAEKFPGFFDLPAMSVSIEVTNYTDRRIVLSTTTALYEKVISDLPAGGTKQ